MFYLILALYFTVQTYILRRYYQLLPQKKWLKRCGLLLSIILFFSMPVALFFGKSLPLWLITPLYFIGTSWMVGLFYFLIPPLLMDLFRLLNYFTKWLKPQTFNGIRFANGKVALGLIIGFSLFFYWGNQNYHHKIRTEYKFDLQKKQLITSVNKCEYNNEPLKIVMISDLHLGYMIHRGELEEWIDLINDEKADYLFIAGDLIDSDVRPLYDEDIIEALNSIKTQKGVYMVLGNHEYHAGVEKSIEFIERTNITLLRDDVYLLDEGIYLVGRDDRTNQDRASFAKLTENLDKFKPMIVLDHQPYKIYENEYSSPFLQFSGHVHDGQIWPFNYVAKMINGVLSGFYSIDKAHFAISPGLGLWGGKFRFGTHSDYVVFNFCY